METFQVILICLYVVFLVLYCFVKTRPKLARARIFAKLVLATIYLSLALANLFTSGIYPFPFFKTAVCLACVFAWAGDCLLLSKRTFAAGVAGFFVANLLLISAEVDLMGKINLGLGDFLGAAIIFVIFYGGLAVMQMGGFISFGKRVLPLNVYIATATLSGSLGLMLACNGNNIFYALFGIGAGLFMVSDYLMGAYLYKFKIPVFTVANSILYFSGMFMVALSLAF